MIIKNAAGGTLSALFNDRIKQSFTDDTESPVDAILFCRKVSGTWYNRDVTGLWIGMGDIEKGMADQPGVSEGTEATFSFANAPQTVLRTAYTGGTDLLVEDRTFGQAFSLAVGDWITLSDFEHSEQRRITEVFPTLIRVSRAFFHSYTAGAQVRFFFARHPTLDVLGPTDAYNGWLVVKAGYNDASLNESIHAYLGRVNAGNVFADDTLVLTAQDRVKELVDYEFADDIEFDDRGVATVPKPNANNKGNGTIESVRYHSGKRPRKITTETWTLTFTIDSQVYEGVTYDTSGWALAGTTSGTIDSGDDFPDGTPTDRFLASGNIEAGEIGERTWVIDDALVDIGWGTTIREGKKAFATGDTFRLFTQAAGTVCVVNGGDYNLNKIDALGLSDLRFSSILSYFLATLLAWTHDNPEGTTSALLSNLTALQGSGADQFSQLRGRFAAGTRAIDVIDDGLKTVDGWLVSSEDDHLRVYVYSPLLIDSPTSFDLSSDVDNPDRTRTVIEATGEPLAISTVRNRVKITHDIGDTRKEFTTPDSSASTSQAAYGTRPTLIRTESLEEISITSRFLATTTSIRATASRIVRRMQYPLRKFRLSCHPSTLLLELGDTPLLYARDIQFSGRRVWVTRLRKNLWSRVIGIEAQDAQHLDGKWFKIAANNVSAITARWSSDGFIGSPGEERAFIIGTNTLQLDAVGNNNGTYNAELGTPDRWGNFVERNFQIW